MSYKGKFKPKNPQKYVGDPENIIYRSLWELAFMRRLDESPKVLAWASEETYISYFNPIDKKFHRYYPDFFVTMDTDHGRKNIIFEIKPKKYSIKPEKPAKINREYKKNLVIYLINEAKWKYAREYAKRNNAEFQVLTEEHLNIKG
jgi:hypothetical protein